MAMKIFDRDTSKWVICGSAVAASIRVLDYEGKFKAEEKTVENCLSEIKDDLVEAQKAIKYIFDHGGNGEGGGGGGSYLPVLTVIGDLSYTITTDEQLTIQYSFTSPNLGNGVVQLSGDGSINEKAISQGIIYNWKVGPFTKGVYYLSLNVKDSQGFWSGAITITISAGALELIDNFDHDQQFAPLQEVEIPYNISAASTDLTVYVDQTFNGETSTIQTLPGDKKWNISMPSMKGVYKGSLLARSGELYSNQLDYSFIVADSSTLYITSKSPTAPDTITTQYGSNLSIEYIISMLGQSSYNVSFYVDGIFVDTVTALNATYTPWIVGNALVLGQHTLQIVVSTKDNLYTGSLDFIVEVVASNFEPMDAVTDGLIAHFESTGQMQDSTYRTTWTNKVEGSTIDCNLYNFNYTSNGWVVCERTTDLPRTGCLYDLPDEDEQGTETVLRFSGKTYAEIGYAPFENGRPKGSGLTIEVLYRTENTGDPDAKVISCRNEPNSDRGFDINTSTAQITTSYGESCNVGFNENEWIRMSFVFDRSTGMIKIYCNGILSGFNNIQAIFGDEDGFKYSGNIILGACAQLSAITDSDGNNIVTTTYDNHANCDIRSVRIYDRSLTSDEIVQNFISDIKIAEEQMAIRYINGYEEGFDKVIPSVTIFTTGVDIDDTTMELPCTIMYSDPINPTKNNTFYNSTIEWQGTSSLEYPIKNYTITLNSGGSAYYGWTPTDDWKPESRWTLKANYMDSSQSDNAGFCKFAHDIGKTNVVPLQKEKEGIRTCIDGFPIMLYKDNGNGTTFSGIYTWNIDRYSYNNYGFADYTEDGTATKNTSVYSYEFNVNNSTVFEEDYSTESAKYSAWLNTVRYHMKHRYNGRTDAATETIVSGSETSEVLLNMDNHKELMSLLEWMASFNDTVDDRAKWVNELSQHWSVEHLIDYFLIAYMFGMVDNLCKNLVITTYGKSTDAEGNELTIWYPNFYDADSILGLNNKGSNVITPGAEMETEYVTTNLRLWKWLIEDVDMWTAIKSKYMDFRANVVNEDGDPFFTIDVMMSYFGGRVSDTIGQSIYNKDFEYKYLNAEQEAHRYMCQGSRRSFIEKWLTQRLLFLDSLFGYGDFEEQLFTVRTNVTGDKTIRIKTYSPQKTTIQFQAGSTAVVLTTNNEEFTDFNFTFTNSKDNELKIKGANNLMAIEGLDTLEISTIDMIGANRLTNVEIPGNTTLREIAIGENHMLRTLDLAKCTNLGSNYANGAVNSNKIIDVSACENLRVLKCNNSKVTGILFPSEGGVLETLDCYSTSISTFNMYGQEYLESINLTDCANVTTINISKCDGLKTFSMPISSVTEVIFSQNYKLEEIDVSNTNYLTTFSIVECTEVKKLNMQYVGGTGISELDLTTLTGLETLDITGSTAIKHLVFCKDSNGQSYSGLKSLTAESSGLTTIRYAIYDDAGGAVNLDNFDLEYLSFRFCNNITKVKNCYLTLNNPPMIFCGCSNLVSVEGELNLSGSIAGTGNINWETTIYGFFARCWKLTTLPTINFTNVTSVKNFFANAPLLSYDQIIGTLKKLDSKCTNLSYFCWRCTNMIGSITSDWFTNLTGVTSVEHMLSHCTGLTGSIPEDLFSPMTNLSSVDGFFYYCTNLTGTIPDKLFTYNKNITTLWNTFNNCTGLTGAIPSILLATQTKLTTVRSMFYNCTGLTELPMTLFSNCKALTTIHSCFYYCTGLISELKDTIFNTNASSNNSITNLYRVFGHCTNLSGKLTEDIFKYCTNVTDVAFCFNYCRNLTGGLPEKIFYYCPKLQYANNIFEGCTSLGSDPDEPLQLTADLFVNNTTLLNVGSMFAQCTNMTGDLPETLFKSCTTLVNAQYMFYDCRYLSGSLYRNFLNYAKNLTSIAYMFYNCNGIGGAIPAKVSHFEDVYIDDNDPSLGTYQVEVIDEPGFLDKCTALTNVEAAFARCWNLVGTIPDELFRYNIHITNMKSCFYGCYQLFGPIPKKIFYYCPSLTAINSVFKNCDGLGNYYYNSEDEENKYCVDPDLFINNKYISNIESAFMCYRTESERNEGVPYGQYSSLIGELPPNLFSPMATVLLDVSNTFYQCTGIVGEVPATLFSSNTSITTAQSIFERCTGLTSMGYNLFSTCKKLTNLYTSFYNCTSLTGSSFNYLALNTVTNKQGCFYNCTKLDNYSELVEAGWVNI